MLNISKEVFDSVKFGANSSKPGVIAESLKGFGVPMQTAAEQTPTFVGKLTGEFFTNDAPIWDADGNKTDATETTIFVEVQHKDTVNRIKANSAIKAEFVETDGVVSLPQKKVRFRIIADTYKEKAFVAGQILSVLTASDKSGDFMPENWQKPASVALTAEEQQAENAPF